jgi:creatine kinase
MQSKFARVARAFRPQTKPRDAMWLLAGAAGAGGSIVMCDTVTVTSTTTTTTTTDGPAAAKAAPVDENYPPFGLAPQIQALPDWIQRGCGDKPYYCPEKDAMWGADGITPPNCPDFSKHNNFMAEVMTPAVYDKLKNRKTANGVNLSHIIKTGMDNPGHPHIKTVGCVAGDEESYVTFKELFDPIIDARHGGYGPDGKQPTNLDISQLSNTDIDPECKYVLTTRVRTGRSVRGFRLPPTIGFEERRALEAVAVKALLNMSGDLKGDYFPLHGSKSYAPKPTGMSEEQETYLRSVGNLFQEPDSTLLLASGMARHWPDGRGIFHNDQKNLFVWLNEEDHLRIVSMQGDRAKPTVAGKQIKDVTARFIRACDEVQKVLKQEGYDFMHNDHHGFVLTCPSNLGTGLRAGTMVNLPKLSARPDWKKLMGAMKLQARGTGGVDSASSGGCWDVSNADRIGKGEVDLVNILIEGAAKLVKWEGMLDAGNGAAVDAEIKAVMG